MCLKFILLAIAYCGYAQGSSSGAPALVCTSMMPNHLGSLPQSSFPNYRVFAPSFVFQGETLTVTMEVTEPSAFFRGFMIQAQVVGSRTVVGRFLVSEGTRNVVCPNYPEGAVATHTSNSDKTSITFQWIAPRDFSGIINFHSTIVQERVIFWVEVNSVAVVVLPNPTLPEEIETPPPVGETTDSPPIDQINAYEGCGTEKVCFGSEEGCLESRNCIIFGAVIYDNEKFVFELLSGTVVSYIAMALSDDTAMGKDSVIECVNQGGTVHAYTSFTTVVDLNFGSPRNENQDIIRKLDYSVTNGRIYCRVERDSFTIVKGMVFDLINDKHHILLASGVEVKANSIGKHSRAEASSEAVLLTVPRNLSVNVRVLIIVHGSFMIVAWIGLASIGIFLARYYKKTWVNQKVGGKHDVWFFCHIICMILTWILTISAFIIIFVEVGQWRTSVHAVTGTIVTILVFFQPIGAVFRPKPSHPSRPIFNFLHFSSGSIMYVLALITILYAVPMTSSGLPDWSAWIIVAFAVFYLLMHLLLTTISICSEIRSKERLGKNQEAPYALLNKTLLGFFALTVFLFVIALILVLVFRPS